MKKILKNKNLIIYICFIAITIIGFIFHENWEDEAQEYLIVKHLDLIGIFKNAYLEGHPIIYYYILYPFIKLGLGYKTINIISLILMYIGVYIILFKLKINTLLKLFFITNYSVLYQSSIIGRSYSLVFLLIILLTYYYKNKEKKQIVYSVLLGLLLNTHLLVSGLSIILFIFTYKDKIKEKNLNKKDIIGIVIYMLSCILLILQFYKILIVHNGMSLYKENLFLSFLGNFFGYPIVTFNNYFNILISIGYIFFFYSFYIFYKSDKEIFIIELFSYIVFVLICSKVWGVILVVHRACIIFFFLIFGYSNIKYKFNKRENIFLILVIITDLIASISFYYLDINYKYSDSYELGNYINKKIKEKETIYTVSDYYSDSYTLAVLPYTENYNYYNLNSNRYYKYIIWDKERERNINYNNVHKKFTSNKTSYLLIPKRYLENKKERDFIKKLNKDFNVKVIYKSDNKSVTRESYILYKIKSN